MRYVFGLALIGVILLAPVAFAAGVNQADTNIIVWLPSFNTYVKFSNPMLFTSAAYFNNHVNFTSAYIVSQGSSAQTFGLGPKSGNATLTTITSDHVELQLVFKSSETLYFIYSIPSSLPAGTEPDHVVYTDGQSMTTLPNTAFTTPSGFLSCSAPCVFVNPNNDTIGVKSAALSPATVDVYVPVGSSSGIVNNPPPATSTIVTTQTIPPTISTTNSTSSSGFQLSNPLILLIGGLGAILMLVVIVISRQKPEKKRNVNFKGRSR